MASATARLKKVQHGVLALLRPHTFSSSSPVPEFLTESESWADALGYAQKIHAALPFLVQCDRAEWSKNVPKASRTLITDALHRERMLLALLDWELEKAIEVLSAARLPVIVLKGMDVSRRYYPNRMFRPMTDVDLLVRPRDFSKVVARMEAAGYSAVGPRYPGRFRVELSRGEGRPVVEIHSSLLRGDDADFMKNVWKRAVDFVSPDFPHPMKVLCHEHQLFYLGAHAAVQHLVESPIWLNDIHFLLERADDALKWSEVLARIQARHHVTSFWFLFTLLKAWGTPVPDDVLKTLTTKVAPTRRAALNILATWERLFPFSGRGWTWVLSARFWLRDNALGALAYALERRKITRIYQRFQRA